jgi:hypothetical protein
MKIVAGKDAKAVFKDMVAYPSTLPALRASQTNKRGEVYGSNRNSWLWSDRTVSDEGGAETRLVLPGGHLRYQGVPTLAALFEVDSNYGGWLDEVATKDSCFVIGGRTILYFDSSKALPDWKALSVDLVIDCTGRATTRSGAQTHLAAGAKRVLMSAPSKKQEDCDGITARSSESIVKE